MTRELPQELQAVNYTGVITSNFFVEAQYSEREFAFVGSGAKFTDRINGTLLVARDGSRFWSATFCGVCGPEERDNENFLAKANYFLSTDSHGLARHRLRLRHLQRHPRRQQPPVGLRLPGHLGGLRRRSTAPCSQRFIPRQSRSSSTTRSRSSSQGTDFITNSMYLNDRWRLNERWSFNLGVRYDQNDGADAEGVKVVDDHKISPRLGLTWDTKADGDFLVNLSAARYVAAIANNQADSQSKGGHPAQFTWFYRGPAINPVGGRRWSRPTSRCSSSSPGSTPTAASTRRTMQATRSCPA